MVLAKRRAEVSWNGTLEEGQGSFTVGNWMLGEVPVTWASRTSPEELIAAAHASCYAMALSLVLDERGTPPENIEVEATCVLDEVSEGLTSTSVAGSRSSTPTVSRTPPSTPTTSAPSPTHSRATSRSG